MIFITVGTSKYQFNRLLELIDELCEDHILDRNEVIAQVGFSNYRPKNYKYFDFTSAEDHKKYIENAKFIISHSGTGSVVSAIKMMKRVIIFPRLSKYQEHADNHQVELVNAFKEKRYVLSASNRKELLNCIINIEKFIPNEYKSNKNNMNRLIIKFIHT